MTVWRTIVNGVGHQNSKSQTVEIAYVGFSPVIRNLAQRITEGLPNSMLIFYREVEQTH
jgi:hypothetical protein